MKRIILILILSIILTFVILISYSIFKFNIEFKTEKEDFDKYLSIENILRDKILKNKLKYKIISKYNEYNKSKFDIIMIDNPINDNYLFKKKPAEILDNLRKWLNKDKRLIVFYNMPPSNDNSDDKLTYNEKLEPANNLSDESTDEFLDSSSDKYNDKYFNYLKYQNDPKSIVIKSKDPLFEDVDSLLINEKCDLKIENDNLEILLMVNGNTIIAREKISEGEIIYIADYYIFCDKNILKNDNAVFLNNLFKKYYNKTIVIDKNTDNTPFQEKSFLEMSSFPYLLIQLILLGVIFFLVYFKRFGSPRDKDLYKKRSVVRHLESVGSFFEKCKRNDIVAKIFDQYFLERLHKIIKIKSGDEKNFIADIKKRFNLSIEERELFILNNNANIIDNQIKRELFLRKFKRSYYERGKKT